MRNAVFSAGTYLPWALWPVLFGAASSAWSCPAPVAKLIAVEGAVQVGVADVWQDAQQGQALCPGTRLAVRSRSRAVVVLADEVTVRLGPDAVIYLHEAAPNQALDLDLLGGVMHVLTRLGKRFQVLTPYLNAMVDGTEFTVRVAGQATAVSVTQGRVRVANEQSMQTLVDGASAQARAAQGPTAIALTPRDAVQWALYFPQMVQPDTTQWPAEQQAAVALAQQGQYGSALAAWPAHASDVAPEMRAGWWLGLGRVQEALDLVQGQTSAGALALQALIKVVQNETEAASTLVAQALRLNDQDASVQLAHSYVLQGQHQLDAARQAAQRATVLQPTHALAWVRLAELQLSSGQLTQGLASAERAWALNPLTPRAVTMRGWAQLLRGQNALALATLTEAQTRDANDPWVHLGLGLLALRQGQVNLGRHALEIAVILNPGHSETRALLARAYSEAGLQSWATTELDLAKMLDPRNPTPWFVQGVAYQRQGQAVQAAQAFEAALARNDQRSVVRSSQLLSVDQATRSAALADAWRALGFDEALRSSARLALSTDPQNEASHRLLASAYDDTADHESARVSELLQAQLRQSPHTPPVAPQALLAFAPIGMGSRSLGLQETQALLDETHGGARLGIMAGNQSTWGHAANVWRQLGDGQLSFGHFQYQTNGASLAKDLQLSTQNLLWQTRLTPDFNGQIELRRARRSGAEITQKLIPPDALEQERRTIDTNTARLGLRYASRPEQEWLGSFIWRDRDETYRHIYPRNGNTIDHTEHAQRSARLSEIMLTTTSWRLPQQIGLSSFRESGPFTTLHVNSRPGRADRQTNDETRTPNRHDVAFTTLSAPIFVKFLAHAGMSVDHFSSDGLQLKKVHPKWGLSWQPTPTLAARVAYFGATTGSSLKEQTMLPTQFVGFNQLFDEPMGTTSRQLAVALDHHLAQQPIHWGLELIERRADIHTTNVPKQGPVYTIEENRYQWYANAYLGPRMAFHTALSHESQQAKQADFPSNLPKDLQTWQLQARISYFHPRGWSGHLQARGVRQTAVVGELLQAYTRFALLDAGLRYQTPQRRWTLLLDINNLFNRQFDFQNAALSGGYNLRVPIFQSGRTAWAKLEMRL